MSHGMIISDLYGNVIIDEIHPVFVFRESGTYAVGGPGSTIIPITQSTEILFACIRPSTACYVTLLSLSPSTATLKTGIQILTNGTGNIQWAVFQARTTTAIPKYGIVIYDSSEDVVFHTNDNYMVSKWGYSFLPCSSIGLTREIPVIDADSNYFIFEGLTFYAEITDGSLSMRTTYYATGMKKISSSRLEATLIPYYSSTRVSTYAGEDVSAVQTWSVNGYISEYNSAK